MKLIRVLIYEGDELWMEKQLSNSLPDGIKDLSCQRTIKVITLGTIPDHLDLLLVTDKES